jgi:hypothetical protein
LGLNEETNFNQNFGIYFATIDREEFGDVL